MFFPGPGAALVVAGCIALGALGAMGTSGILSKTVLRHEESTFLMEIPPMRRPKIGQILVRSLVDRTFYVAGRALTVAAPAGVVLWGLANCGLLGTISGILDPIGKGMGMNGMILLAFLLSLPANELLLPVILMTLTGSGNLYDAEIMGGTALLASAFSTDIAVCTMVFTIFHWPCSTTLLTIYRETKSAAKTAAGFLLPTAVGVILCLSLHLLFGNFCA
jgi:ferrous iron transport protein B